MKLFVKTVYCLIYPAIIDLNALHENQCKLKTYQQISLAIKIVYHACDRTFLLISQLRSFFS